MLYFALSIFEICLKCIHFVSNYIMIIEKRYFDLLAFVIQMFPKQTKNYGKMIYKLKLKQNLLSAVRIF